MFGADLKRHFLEAAASWLCDGYGLDVRYIARELGGKHVILDAAITLWPLAHRQDERFHVEAGGIVAGRHQIFPVSKEAVLDLLQLAAEGQLTVGTTDLSLESLADLDYYSEMIQRERWFFPLHLRTSCRRSTAPGQSELLAIDGALRAATPPFDGLSDLAATLGLNADLSGSTAPALTIHVSPPVDLIIERTRLADDKFTATLHAHPNLDRSRVGFAVRAAPLTSPEGRKQLASRISWAESLDGRCAGTVEADLPRANSVLSVLVLGEITVRRQWFLDPNRAESQRYIALNFSDPELKQLRQGLFDHPDSYKFEQAIAGLLFLLGFSPALPLESNAPDIVAATPAGRQIVVECTLRVGDFASKAGKLVDRRAGLQKTLAAANLPSSVAAVLVCRLPRDQIAALAGDLVSHKIILITGEDLLSALNHVRFPGDPDQLLDDGLEQLERNSSAID